jgi:hypothetical protein
MDDGEGEGGYMSSNWDRIPIPKNPQRLRKYYKTNETLATRRTRLAKLAQEQQVESDRYLEEARKQMPIRRNVNLPASPRIFLSEADAFDRLCADALKAERFPQEVVMKGSATGWFERIRMLGQNYGWDVVITIRDRE